MALAFAEDRSPRTTVRACSPRRATSRAAVRCTSTSRSRRRAAPATTLATSPRGSTRGAGWSRAGRYRRDEPRGDRGVRSLGWAARCRGLRHAVCAALELPWCQRRAPAARARPPARSRLRADREPRAGRARARRALLPKGFASQEKQGGYASISARVPVAWSGPAGGRAVVVMEVSITRTHATKSSKSINRTVIRCAPPARWRRPTS